MARRSGSYGGGAGGGRDLHGRHDRYGRGAGDHGDRGAGHGGGGSRGDAPDLDRPGPVPGRYAVADFAPVRPGPRGRRGLRRITHGRRRVAAAVLAVAAAATSAQAARGDHPSEARTEAGHTSGDGPTAPASGGMGRTTGGVGRTKGVREQRPTVSAPVRIADAATVRLLRRGDMVDVISGADGTRPARVVARAARVDRLPRSLETGPAGAADGGALVVLKVPRRTATALVGAGTAGRLAVTLC